MVLSPNVKPGIIVMFFGFLGMILAFLLEYFNSHGYVIDEYLQGSITLPDLQIVVVVFFILIGILIAVVTS